MQHQISDKKQLNVEITVKASDEEIEKLRACIAKGIGSTNAAPVVHIAGMSAKGTPRYTIKFSVPPYFSLSSVQKWLNSVVLVGYKITAEIGPKE